MKVDAERPSLLKLFDDHDQEFLTQIHLLDRLNPDATDRHQLVVIGGGTAGLSRPPATRQADAQRAEELRDVLQGVSLRQSRVRLTPSRFVLSPSVEEMIDDWRLCPVDSASCSGYM